MTALLGRGGTDFSLVCDGCGRMVANLAASTGRWPTAWILGVLDGWSGSELAVGPHGCAGCGTPDPAGGMVARSLAAPAGRPRASLQARRLDDVLAVTLRGYLACTDDVRLADLLAGDLGRYPHVLLDVGEVPQVSSATVDVLYRAAVRTTAGGGRLCLAGAGPRVAGALRLLGLDGALPAYPDRASALDRLRSDAPAGLPVAGRG